MSDKRNACHSAREANTEKKPALPISTTCARPRTTAEQILRLSVDGMATAAPFIRMSGLRMVQLQEQIPRHQHGERTVTYPRHKVHNC